MKTLLGRGWVVSGAAMFIALCLFVGGVVAWRMTSIPVQGVCPPRVVCVPMVMQGHRIHPLRAEILWALSGIFVMVAFISAARPLTRWGQSSVPAQ
jgi:hypothetical protein